MNTSTIIKLKWEFFNLNEETVYVITFFHRLKEKHEINQNNLPKFILDILNLLKSKSTLQFLLLDKIIQVFSVRDLYHLGTHI